jgi:ribosomal-protein-alanine N-acetyltransferase
MQQDRISLNELDQKYAKDLLPIWNDWEVIKYTLVRDVKTLDDCKERIKGNIEWSIKTGSLGPFVVKRNDETIGFCGGVKTSNNSYEIFYHISRKHWGKGIGTIISEKLLKMAFIDRDAIAVTASAVDKNIASWKILEKMNMKRIGTEKREAIGDEQLYKYKITRDAYLAKRI